jgi:hypothetical protein
MSSVTRQQNLFAAESWKVAYKAYTNISYQAYDYDTIRAALVEYVRTNFPENFNDYIESSEFIAIIELLAYLSQSLAFRMDINTRENFLETAERRDSVFKLARMLGYTPNRNYTASGLVKVVSVKTNEPLTDSQGNDLNNREVFWDDANNPQSYEQFISILNSSMSNVNRFTSPVKTGRVGDVLTELYQLNTPLSAPVAYQYSATVAGDTKPFNIVNPDFQDNGSIFERHPDPASLFNLLYRNDSNGLASKDTGFFLAFHQGNLTYKDYNYTTPVASRTEDVQVININETDAYLQEITGSGLVKAKWVRIPNVVGQTLNYNSISKDTKNLYSIDNLDNSGIQLKFADGNFANVPYGIYRLWYRPSDPTRYTIQPESMSNISIDIPYVSKNGNEYRITMKFSLQRSVNNSLPAESLQAIKERAPQIYYTQDRMVNGQDYNVFPKTLNSNIRKLKAINRTHAGHSRYIDINDPTGTYHDVDTFARDGFLYVDDASTGSRLLINDNTTSLDVVTATIPGLLKGQRLNNFVYYGMRNITEEFTPDVYDLTQVGGIDANYAWNCLPFENKSLTGYVTETFSTGDPVIMSLDPVDPTQIGKNRMFQENNFIKWVDPTNKESYIWTRVVKVTNNGELISGLNTAKGPFTLAAEVTNGWVATECVATIRKTLTSGEATAIKNAIDSRRSFGIGYNPNPANVNNQLQDQWYVIDQPCKTCNWKPTTVDYNSSWLILMEYVPVDRFTYSYNVTVRGQDYVVQSEQELKFYNIKNVKVIDSDNKSGRDEIIFSTVNTKAGTTETNQWQTSGATGNYGFWVNQTTGYKADPEGFSAGIPLLSRSIKWFDVSSFWKSNFGLFFSDPARSAAGQSNLNVLSDVLHFTGPASGEALNYVADATIQMATYYDDGTARSVSQNVTIANNSGTISSIPSYIDIPFDQYTFGGNIISLSAQNTPTVTYRQFNVDGAELNVYHGGANGAYSFGTVGVTDNQTGAGVKGRLELVEGNFDSQTGTLRYSRLNENIYHASNDDTGFHSDKIVLDYSINKDHLDVPLEWVVYDVFKYPDGYTDPSRVFVIPKDSDGDGVPDRPLQFHEYVNNSGLVLFEYYTDFDGYTYERPYSGVVWDLRQDVNGINFVPSTNSISPGSYNAPRNADDLDWLLLKDFSMVKLQANPPVAGIRTWPGDGLENDYGLFAGMIVTVEDSWTDTQSNVTYPEGATYQLVAESTDLNRVRAIATDQYFVRTGRGKTQDTSSPDPEDSIMRWNHVAPNDVRIDPSISNVVEMIILTENYYNNVISWSNNPTGDFPSEPTSAQLSVNFSSLNQYKAASDTITYRSAKFVKLFGPSASSELQAVFRIVKLSNQYSDNELRSRVLTAIKQYFDPNNWEFGEAFFFTELSTYIHQQLGSAIGSIVILPKNTTGTFGELFQVQSMPNELFISTATVNDIEIINQIDSQTLRTDR